MTDQVRSSGAGRAIGRGGRGERGRTSGRFGNQGQYRQFARKARFEGKCIKLKDFVYDCQNSRQADQYIKTTEAISEYVDTEFEHGADITAAIEAMEDIDFNSKSYKPSDLDQGKSDLDKYIWQKEVDQYIKRKYVYNNNKTKFYGLIWGQCSETMRMRVEGKPNHKNTYHRDDL